MSSLTTTMRVKRSEAAFDVAARRSKAAALALVVDVSFRSCSANSNNPAHCSCLSATRMSGSDSKQTVYFTAGKRSRPSKSRDVRLNRMLMVLDWFSRLVCADAGGIRCCWKCRFKGPKYDKFFDVNSSRLGSTRHFIGPPKR
jgi:hypothetical protein